MLKVGRMWNLRSSLLVVSNLTTGGFTSRVVQALLPSPDGRSKNPHPSNQQRRTSGNR